MPLQPRLAPAHQSPDPLLHTKNRSVSYPPSPSPTLLQGPLPAAPRNPGPSLPQSPAPTPKTFVFCVVGSLEPTRIPHKSPPAASRRQPPAAASRQPSRHRKVAWDADHATPAPSPHRGVRLPPRKPKPVPPPPQARSTPTPPSTRFGPLLPPHSCPNQKPQVFGWGSLEKGGGRGGGARRECGRGAGGRRGASGPVVGEQGRKQASQARLVGIRVGSSCRKQKNRRFWLEKGLAHPCPPHCCPPPLCSPFPTLQPKTSFSVFGSFEPTRIPTKSLRKVRAWDLCSYPLPPANRSPLHPPLAHSCPTPHLLLEKFHATPSPLAICCDLVQCVPVCSTFWKDEVSRNANSPNVCDSCPPPLLPLPSPQPLFFCFRQFRTNANPHQIPQKGPRLGPCSYPLPPANRSP